MKNNKITAENISKHTEYCVPFYRNKHYGTYSHKTELKTKLNAAILKSSKLDLTV